MNYKTKYLRLAFFADYMKDAIASLLLTVMGQAGLSLAGIRSSGDIKIEVKFKDGEIYYEATVTKQERHTTAADILIALDDEFEKISWLVGVRVYVVAVDQLPEPCAVTLSLTLESPEG